MIWEPSPEFIENTNVWRMMRRLGLADREAFLLFSRENPERFWDEMTREMRVDWFHPYHRVVDTSRGPEWSQWFLGGRLNIAHNCVDRWAGSGRVACIWEVENGASGSLTFSQLRQDAARVANGLRTLGLQPGDRVALCMPMVPEILAILYGCLQSGLTVVPIFAGFGPAAIATRLADSGARVLFTAPHLERRGKRLPLAEKMRLRQDENNTYTLGHLASVQVELNHLEDAEKNINKALSIDPEEPACLLLKGYLCLQQNKYDQALDALSLSAKLLPEDARPQYLLGKVLLQKGAPAQAETALRKAVQLMPGYREAHYTLALIYSKQKPPLKELAQWHYRKATHLGYPADPELEKQLQEAPAVSSSQ